eukprot:4711054-Prymnesium_polylepis.1
MLPRGEYAVTWRVRASSRWGDEPISFSVRAKDVLGAGAGGAPSGASDAPSLEVAMAPQQIKALPATAGWADIPLGTFAVTTLAAEVVARAWKHTGTWVGPISLDCVHFARVG